MMNRMLVSLPAAMFAAASFAFDGPVAAQPPLTFTTEPVLQDSMWNSPTSTAIDKAGNVHMTYMTQLGTASETKEIWYARKDTATSEWSFTRLTNNTVREEFPSIALDAQDNVHIAFHTGIDTTNKVRYVNNIDAQPGTFNQIIDITGPGYVITRLQVDSAGTVHLVFRSQFSPGPQEIYYTTWSQSGGVGMLVNISNSPAQEDSSVQIALDANDKAHIVWQRGSALGGPLAYVNNVSGSFQAQSTGVAGSVVDPQILISDAGVITIFYRPNLDALLYVENAGGGFGAPLPVYTGVYRSAFADRFAVDADGHRYVAFASNVAVNRGTVFVRETARGWEKPVFLAGPNGGGNQGTSVALNDDGKLVVSYQLSGSANGMVFADIFLASASLIAAPCPADISPTGGDGSVNIDDLLIVIGSWGPCPTPPEVCPADLTDDDQVNIDDLLAVIGAWGPCP